MTDLTARRTALLSWAQSCLAAEDWHGLSDAAMDLLVVDARLDERESLQTVATTCRKGTYAELMKVMGRAWGNHG